MFGRLLTPRVILPVALLLVTVIVLNTPVVDLGVREARLTTHSTDGHGAKGLYQSLDRLGWTVRRSSTEFRTELESGSTYVLLAPPIPLVDGEVRAILSAVRRGARLFYVVSGSSALADSLGVLPRRGPVRGIVSDSGLISAIAPEDPGCRRRLLEDRLLAVPAGLDVVNETIRLRESAAAGAERLVMVRGDTAGGVIAAGFSFGAGRVLVVSEKELLRNDVIRRCDRREGALAVRLVNWLSPPGTRTLVFDEYHHGYGLHPSLRRAVMRALLETAPGRVLLQICVAALVLLLAAAARPLAPMPRQRIERRSPLEHVGALARAYEQVGATRRGARLLVRGLRRRRDAASWRRGNDEEFLRAIVTIHPELENEVKTVVDATRRPQSPEDFIGTGQAVEHIERILKREYR